MLTWIPVISPVDIQLSVSQPLLPKREETIVDVEYEVHDDEPPTSLLAQSEREDLVQGNLGRTPDQWREKLAALQRRLKGEE